MSIEPAADTEPLGTLSIQQATAVVIVDGSGAIAPNPVAEDSLVEFSFDVRNDETTDATVDVNVFDNETLEAWTTLTAVTIPAGATETLTLSVVPQDVPKDPGNWTMVGQVFNITVGAERAGITPADDLEALGTLTVEQVGEQPGPEPGVGLGSSGRLLAGLLAGAAAGAGVGETT